MSAPFFSRNESSPHRDGAGGWSRRRRCRSTCRSALHLPGACSRSRWKERVPRPDWKPRTSTPEATVADSIVAGGRVSANNAIKTPQSWLLWVVSCLSVTAGISILEKASPIYQDFFPAPGMAAAAAGYVAMLSLANMLGRIGWSSLSDKIGWKNAYRMSLGVGALLYLAITLTTNSNKVVFLPCTLLILSFYGAGFATAPAHLRDLFGTYQVGVIHARLLTAWSVAGILGRS